MIRLNLFMIWLFALSFLIISYLQVLSSKLIKSNHCCFSIYSFHAFFVYRHEHSFTTNAKVGEWLE